MAAFAFASFSLSEKRKMGGGEMVDEIDKVRWMVRYGK